MTAIPLAAPVWPNEWTPCRTTDPEVWFPESGATREANKAKALCKTQCPQASFNACLKFSLDNYVEGIWAGLSERERRNLKRRRRAA